MYDLSVALRLLSDELHELKDKCADTSRRIDVLRAYVGNQAEDVDGEESL